MAGGYKVKEKCQCGQIVGMRGVYMILKSDVLTKVRMWGDEMVARSGMNNDRINDMGIMLACNRGCCCK